MIIHDVLIDYIDNNYKNQKLCLVLNIDGPISKATVLNNIPDSYKKDFKLITNIDVHSTELII